MPCSNQIKYFTLRAEITCRQTMHIDNHDCGSDSIILLIFSAKHIFGSVRTFPFLCRKSTIVLIYWVTQKLPQIYTANYVTFPIQIRKIKVHICGNFWVTQYIKRIYCKIKNEQIQFYSIPYLDK